MLTDILIRLRNLRLIVKLLLQGVFLVTVLVVIQAWVENSTKGFLSYLAPLGLVFLLSITFLIVPIFIGALNVLLIHALYNLKGWQVGFWLNGIFLLIVFSTINTVLQTSLKLPFLPYIAAIDFAVLSFPLGCIARFSNGGWKKPID